MKKALESFKNKWGVAGLKSVLFLFLAVIFLPQMGCQNKRDIGLGTSASPLVFMLSSVHGAKSTASDRTRLAKMLGDASGLVIKIEVAKSHLEGIESFDEHTDFGLLTLFDYFLARQEYNVDAGLQVLRYKGSHEYTGEIVVRKNSPFQSLRDLKGKRIAYVDPFSTSGFIFPAMLFHNAHVPMESKFVGSHAAALAWLSAGSVDAAAVYSRIANRDQGVKVIAHTAEIPDEAILFRSSLKKEIREKLKKALISVASSSQGAKLLLKISDITGFRPISNSDYSPVLDQIKDYGLSVYELVPDGKYVQSRLRDFDPISY